MIVSIENEFLSVSAESAGAQLKSIKSKKSGREYLWQGNEKYWTGRAYNLFPIIGRMTDNRYTYKGREYEMLIHGFVRRNELALKNRTDCEMTFSINSNDVTRPQYPFEFEFSVTFSLEKNSLKIKYTVENKGDGEMIFGVGGHPGFNVPFAGGEFEEYFVEFPDPGDLKQNLMSDDCYLTGEKSDFKTDGGKVLLRHELFDRDVVILENTGGTAFIRGKNTPVNIRFDYPDMKYLGLWHKPKTDAPFLCLEPWSALPATYKKIDELENKADMTHLKAGGIYENTYKITVNE